MTDVLTNNDGGLTVAKFITGPHQGEEVEGTFIEGLLYHYDGVEYLCHEGPDGNLVLYENRNVVSDILTSSLPTFYF